MSYTLIDAHSHLWLRQDTSWNGLPIRSLRNGRSIFRAVIHYLEKGHCPVDRLISRVVTPEEAPLAIQQWNDSPGKVFRILVRF